MHRRALLLILLLLSIAGLALLPAGPHPAGGVEIGQVRMCPGAAGSSRPPDFAGPRCRTLPIGQADPQGRAIWLQADFQAPGALLAPPRPLGLFISASASSEAWLNGEFLGRNGVLGDGAAGEAPGRLDGVIYVPSDLVRPGANRLVLHMSSHRGVLRLANPIQRVGIGDYARPADLVLRRYWPALATLGVFLLAALRFAAMALRGEDRRGHLVLTLMSLFAAGQLLTETARGVFAYAYPLQDLRLVLIVAFSLGFGLCLAAHVLERFMARRRGLALSAIAAAAAAAIAAAPGFDAKAIAGLLAPTLSCAAGAAVWTWRGRPHAGVYLAALSAFAALMLLAPGAFLDMRFFYAVAGLLLFLGLERAGALDPQPPLPRSAPAAGTIRIKTAGRIALVATDQISHCNGAGDYVELCFRDGGQALHNMSLNALGQTLPASFLRVHRSHIVNLNLIRSLTRHASGAGRLELINGASVPVSRRIMPSLRSALGGQEIDTVPEPSLTPRTAG